MDRELKSKVAMRIGIWEPQACKIIPGLPQDSVLFNVYTVDITLNPFEGPGRTLRFANDNR